MEQIRICGPLRLEKIAGSAFKQVCPDRSEKAIKIGSIYPRLLFIQKN